VSPEEKKDEVEETTEEAPVEATSEVAPSEEPAAEEAKPKRTRTRKAPAKAEAAESEESEEAKPKRTRKAPAKAKAEETEAEEAKPKRTRKAPAKAEKSEEAEEAPKPRRRGRAAKEEEPPEERELVLVRAEAKYVRTSARKARLVCDHIRGKDVEQAKAVLAFTPRSAAKAWSKLLASAVANAEHNHELVGDELRIAAVYADEGPTLKRYRPKAMGRATRIRKRTAHLTIELTPKE
jgi:ribosomal protein L22